MHLESTQEQHIGIEHADLDLQFMQGETIHTENSYKFTDGGIERQSRLVHPHTGVRRVAAASKHCGQEHIA